MSRRAKFVRDMGWRGDARLYRLSESIDVNGSPCNHVVVSGVDVPLSGPETYIFPHDGGEGSALIEYLEIEGSFKGAIDHGRALRGLGFEEEG